MNQQRLPIRREKPSLRQKTKDAQAGQLEAARIILADPKYQGLQREWAERVIARAKQNGGELF